jgi:hypothetical protein
MGVMGPSAEVETLSIDGSNYEGVFRTIIDQFLPP